jgi:hypothetical protein
MTVNNPNQNITLQTLPEEVEDAEDALLYRAMTEGDNEIIPIEKVEQMLKDKINERNFRP